MPQTITLSPIGPFDATGERAARVPGSKSLTNRALLLGALARGRSVIRRPLWADDTQRMLEALRALGFSPDSSDPEAIGIQGAGGAIPADRASLMLGNAGTAMRSLTAACCLGEGEYRLDGIARMRQRPIGELVEALGRMGARIDALGVPGYPPLRITARGLRGGALTMGPTLSSQFISALLMVGPCTREGVELRFQGPVTSQPYVRMTLGLMARFDAEVDSDGPMTVARAPAGGYAGTDYTVEPDASSATYFYAAAAAIPGSRCAVADLPPPGQSLQGDTAFVDVLEKMGAEVERGPGAVTVTGGPGLKGVDVDLGAIPDAAMTIAALAVLARGPTTIRNVGNWRVKETDRMAAMRTELTRLGAGVRVAGDDLTITPPPGGRITPATIETYDDHRMAMAISVIGIARPGVTIADPACVNKTYPGFFGDLAALGEGSEDRGAQGPREAGRDRDKGSDTAADAAADAAPAPGSPGPSSSSAPWAPPPGGQA